MLTNLFLIEKISFDKKENVYIIFLLYFKINNMKYIKNIIITLFIFLFSLEFSLAANTENLLYKNISITNMEIKQIYWEKKSKTLIKALDKFFIKIRLNKNTKKLKEIENKMSKVLKKLQNKKTLNRKERNLRSVAWNIYYRSRVLSDYILK